MKAHIVQTVICGFDGITLGARMKDDHERSYLIAHAVVQAVLELRTSGIRCDVVTVPLMLEQLSEDERQLSAKEIYRDAAELIRTGKWRI